MHGPKSRRYPTAWQFAVYAISHALSPQSFLRCGMSYPLFGPEKTRELVLTCIALCCKSFQEIPLTTTLTLSETEHDRRNFDNPWCWDCSRVIHLERHVTDRRQDRTARNRLPGLGPGVLGTARRATGPLDARGQITQSLSPHSFHGASDFVSPMTLTNRETIAR